VTTRDGVHGEMPDGASSLTSSPRPAARIEHASDGTGSRAGTAISATQVECVAGGAGSPADAALSTPQVECAPNGTGSRMGMTTSAVQVGCAPNGAASPTDMATSTARAGYAPNAAALPTGTATSAAQIEHGSGGTGSRAGMAISAAQAECAPSGTGTPAGMAGSLPHVRCATGEGPDTAGRRVSGPGSGAVSLGVVGGVALLVGVFLGVRGSGWVWPLLFLAAVVVVGVLVGRRPWLVVGMVVVTGALLSAPDGLVRYLGSLWLWVAALLGAAAVLGSVRRCVPTGVTVLWHLALLLPRGERELWRAEVGSVLHACSSAAERRRQVRGFLAAVPATVLTSWRVRR